MMGRSAKILFLVILGAFCTGLVSIYSKFTTISSATITNSGAALQLSVANSTCVTSDFSPSDWKAVAVCTNSRCGTERQKKVEKMPKGFVISLNYYDQQISALRRLLNLQCWAAQNKMAVVEPFFIHETRLGLSLAPEVDDKPTTRQLKFSDVFDIQQWNSKRSIPLTSWKTFHDSAPKDVILVRIKLKDRNTDLMVPCSPDHVMENQVYDFLAQHNFRVCKKVCIDLYRYSHELLSEELSDIVFGKTRDVKVTLVFAMWTGIKMSGNFVCRTGRFCRNLNPSARSIRDGNVYVQKWLNGNRYIAVMLRLEKIHSSGKSVAAVLDKTLKLWSQLKDKVKCNTTFLSLDVGRFGSKDLGKAGSKIKAYVMENAQTFFHKIYGNSISFDAWEESFVNVSGTTEPSYISALQTAIAARAQCVLLVGGGEFQSRVLQLHKNYHRMKPCHVLL